jgi:hypothetical protein
VGHSEKLVTTYCGKQHRDAALFALFGTGAALFFGLLHDLEMRRGLAPFPGTYRGC